MSERITEELRTWVTCNRCRLYDSTAADLRRIADRIDTAHERSYREQIDSAADAAWESLDNSDDEVAAKHGFVRLPVDADGEPWRFGDSCSNGGRLNAIHLYANGNGRLDFRGGTKVEVARGSTTSRHHKPTPAERLRDVYASVCSYSESDEVPSVVVGSWADEIESVIGELDADGR